MARVNMARVNKRRNPLLGFLLCAFASVTIAIGCGEQSLQMEGNAGPSIRVTYKGEPLGDVQVRLHQSPDGPVLAQSISNQDGNAFFERLPSPEPAHYHVTIESLADGGWILDPMACKRLSQKTKLNPLESSPHQEIEVPDGAVQSLSPTQSR